MYSCTNFRNTVLINVGCLSFDIKMGMQREVYNFGKSEFGDEVTSD